MKKNLIFSFFLVLFPIAAVAEDYEKVLPCDEYAAHPFDHHRWTVGVLDEKIIPGPAVKFCREAVEAHTNVARFQFQLGRSLWAAHEYEEGLKVFLELEESTDYGPVYAYLADAYMWGIGGVDTDEELAITLYQLADEEGFLPAGEVLALLSAEQSTQQTSSQVVENIENFNLARLPDNRPSSQLQTTQEIAIAPEVVAFDAGVFLKSDIMRGLYHGNLEGINQGTDRYIGIDLTLSYILGFLSQFADRINFRDQSCIALYDPALEKALELKIAKSIPGIGGLVFGGQGTLEQNLNTGAVQGFKILGDMLTGMQNGDGMMGGLVQEEANIAVLKDSGEADGTRLILRHGCQSDVVRRIYANAAAYITGSSPIITPEEQARRKRQEEQEVKKARAEERQILQSNATKSCMMQFDKTSYCGCLIEGLRSEKIDDEEWKRLGSSFREIISVGKNYPSFKDKMKTCRSRS